MDPIDGRNPARDPLVPFLSEYRLAHFGEPISVYVAGRSHPVIGPATTGVDGVLAGDDVVVPAGPRLRIPTGTSPDAHSSVDVRAAAGATVVRFLTDASSGPADA